MKRGSTCSPDEPAVARMRGRRRHPGAAPHLAALMRATGWLDRFRDVSLIAASIGLPATGLFHASIGAFGRKS